MGQRSDLSAILKTICSNVYFQPPESLKLIYPCIVYSLDDLDPIRANNKVYDLKDRYSVIYITRDPDDDAKRTIAELPFCRMSRSYTADNLYHHAYRLYY